MKTNREISDVVAIEPTEGLASSSVLELQALLLGADTLETFLRQLVSLAAASFDEAVMCSVTVEKATGEKVTVASTDVEADEADEVQYENGEGPCLQACATGEEVIVDDLEHETRWGDYPAKARQLGTRSLVALPLRVKDRTLGALNIYAAETAVFTDGTLVQARNFAASAAGAAEIAVRLSEQARLNADLKAALASRRVIDQAIGILMERDGIDPDEAFGQLRRRSQNEHVKLRELAIALVTEVGGKAPKADPAFADRPEQPPRRG